MADLALVALSGGLRHPVPRGRTVVVGRSEASDIVVADATISRRHAELTADGAGIQVRDLGSSNGTTLNGARVTTAVARPDDTLVFGSVSFRVAVVELPPPADPVAPVSAVVPRGTIVRPVTVSGGLPSAMPVLDGAPPDAAPPDDGAGRQARKLRLLLEVSQALAGELDPDRLLERIADVAFETMRVDRIVVSVGERAREGAEPRLARRRPGVVGATPRLPTAFADAVLRDRVALLSDNTQEEYRSHTVAAEQVMSAMACPLLAPGDELLGVLYVDNLTSRRAFTEDDLQFLVAFAGIAALGLRTSRYAEQSRREATVRSNFERFFSPDVASAIAGQEGATTLGGEKRPVVILFSDIRGFTAMSETMSPDAIAELLSGYFSEMVDIVFEHGGTLDKFIGDAIMALWGAPLPMPDAPDRAVRAAVRMQAALAELNARREAAGTPPIGVGIGLNYAEVFAGRIGSQRRLEYTVIGDGVNVASRLCGEAAAGEILLSESLLLALREPPPVASMPPMALKGKAQPLPVYRVVR